MTETVLTMYPTGGYAGWDNINDGVDGTPISISSGLVGGVDVWFNFSKLAVAGVISKITTVYRAYKGYYTASGKTILYTHGTRYAYNDGTFPQETITQYSHDFATNPNTGAAWTWDEINNLTVGVNVYTAWGAYANLYQYYYQIHYTPDTYTPPTLVRGSTGIGCPMMF